MTSRIIVSIIAVFAIVAGFACGDSESPGAPTTDPTTPVVQTPARTGAPASIFNTEIFFRVERAVCRDGQPATGGASTVTWTFGPDTRTVTWRLDFADGSTNILVFPDDEPSFSYTYSVDPSNTRIARIAFDVSEHGNTGRSTAELTFDNASGGRVQYTYVADDGGTCTSATIHGAFEIRSD